MVVVEPDVLRRSELGAQLRERYGPGLSIVETAGWSEAVRLLDSLHDNSCPVVLVMAACRLPDGTATSLARHVSSKHPTAKRVLLADSNDHVATADRLDFDEVHIGRFLPVADSIALLLDRLLPTAEHTDGGVRVVGRRFGAGAYEVKDFLTRNLIPFEWHDVESSARARTIASDLQLPRPVPTTVVLDNGTVLRDPNLVALATALNLTEPATRESYDLVIVGGGPAGLAAAVYGACEGLHVVVVEDSAPGGQAGTTSRIENYLGFPTGLSGADLAHRALVQARRFGVQWFSGHTATSLSQIDDGYLIETTDGTRLCGRTVLLATGLQWRRLAIPGAAALVNKGIYYGASLAEAAQTSGEDVHVVGAGNSAGQAALFLAGRARSVTLLIKGPSLREAPMSQYMVERIHDSPAITIRPHTVIAEALGRDRVEGLVLRDTESGRTETVSATSVYVLIGMAPSTDWLTGTLALDTHGFILTGTDEYGQWPLERKPLITETSMPGVFAAGDVCAGTVKRVGAAVGQGAMAIQIIAQYLRNRVRAGREHPAPRQFDLLDADSNGYIEQDDFDAVVHRLVTGFGESASSQRAHRIRSSYAEFWQALAAIADSDGDHRITREEFSAALRQLADRPTMFTDLADALVALCDTDDDGSINQAEFQKMLSLLGVPVDDVGALYRALDADNSGYLDTAEIADALRRFYAEA